MNRPPWHTVHEAGRVAISEQMGDGHPGEQQDEQDREQATDGHDDTAPATIAPAPAYHPLPAQREQAEIQGDGQAHAEYDANHYSEEATPTQVRTGASLAVISSANTTSSMTASR